jgi:hypothetical protein
MTITPANNDVNALVADVSTGDVTVDFMFGVGLVKDSEAVFFQYVGDNATPQALVQANGKPVTRIGNVYLSGISIVEDFGEFNQTKLNIFLKTQQGASVMLTSGLTTIWSQCLLTSLQGLVNDSSVSSLISIDSWKGTSKMRPCFAAIRNGQTKVTCNDTYSLFVEARANRDSQAKEAIARNVVANVQALLDGEVEELTVTQPESTSF